MQITRDILLSGVCIRLSPRDRIALLLTCKEYMGLLDTGVRLAYITSRSKDRCAAMGLQIYQYLICKGKITDPHEIYMIILGSFDDKQLDTLIELVKVCTINRSRLIDYLFKSDLSKNILSCRLYVQKTYIFHILGIYQEYVKA